MKKGRVKGKVGGGRRGGLQYGKRGRYKREGGDALPDLISAPQHVFTSNRVGRHQVTESSKDWLFLFLFVFFFFSMTIKRESKLLSNFFYSVNHADVDTRQLINRCQRLEARQKARPFEESLTGLDVGDIRYTCPPQQRAVSCGHGLRWLLAHGQTGWCHRNGLAKHRYKRSSGNLGRCTKQAEQVVHRCSSGGDRSPFSVPALFLPIGQIASRASFDRALIEAPSEVTIDIHSYILQCKCEENTV